MFNPLEDLFHEALEHLDTASTLLGTHKHTRANCPDNVSPAFWEDYIARMRAAMTKADDLTAAALKTLATFETDGDFRILATAQAIHEDGHRGKK